MTEYTTSSEAIREYLTARERTARWVQQHYAPDIELLSPSYPPSMLSDSDAPSYGPSESEASSHSTPPRMLLRWTDGRPDMPIPSGSSNHARSRSASHPHPSRHIPESPDVVPPLPPIAHNNFHPGAGSHHPSAAYGISVPSRHAQSLSYASGPLVGPPGQAHSTPPPSPEHIVVLPCPQADDPQEGPKLAPVPPSHVSVSHHGSHYASRTPTAHSAHHPQPIPATGTYPPAPSQQPTIHAPSPHHAYNPSHTSRNATLSPGVQYTQSQPHTVSNGGAHPSRPGTALPYTYSPPAIVYAPSSRHGGSNYVPPQIVYSPSSHAHRGPAPSITYSHSAPMPATQHHPNGGMGVLPANPRAAVPVDTERSRSRVPRNQSHGRSQSASRHHYPHDGSQRGRSTTRTHSPPRSSTPSDAGSRTSGSTYYILPTPGQKVQIIVSCRFCIAKQAFTICFFFSFSYSNRGRRLFARRHRLRRHLSIHRIRRIR